jgi:hypothetical protein
MIPQQIDGNASLPENHDRAKHGIDGRTNQ